MKTIVIKTFDGRDYELSMNVVDNALPFINRKIERLIERSEEMDLRSEIEFDRWAQDHKYDCPTCRYRTGDHPECLDCEGQNWREADLAKIRKEMLYGNGD